ncbi:FAD:protein FMN transferase [Mangrovicella endophytica]|uniref:FAD:protein FMN transferase n=1 Tax=Mangrovicella endophytica TaxID=2066697 RepID=UPI0012FFFC12|nr:FAD:protein FMN transferase [Mangrovicella endophytica]
MRTSFRIDRRRLLSIGAVFAGSALVGASPLAATQADARWSGQALGAHATIRLVGAPDDVARGAFASVEREIDRLERIFSLYRPDTALSRLNREGAVAEPDPELLAVLSLAASAHRLTGGLFDPTVQPVFVALAEHFSAAGANPAGPSPATLERALAAVGFDGVRFDADRIAFERAGMAVTLNGIAQGYITDRIAALLRARGFADMLLDIGEIAAVGRGPDRQGWRVGLAQDPAGTGVAETLTLSNRAVATSMVTGTTLDRDGRVGHIIHPMRGPVTPTYMRVTVIDDSAARADALSTGAALMDAAGIAGLRRAGIEIHV